MKWIYW